jgi:methylated-DNA-[protein]-cysteine S-methyltransferase
VTSGTALTRVEIRSPVGSLLLYAGDTGVVGLSFEDADERAQAHLARRFADLRVETRPCDPLGAADAVRAYLGGDLGAVDRIPVDAGGTPFQAEVWAALRRIPAGTTVSYQELARRVGRPAAMRAVGAANGANPVAVVVPCHRVVAASGDLHGYGGGLERKRWLLVHERALLV